MCLFRSSDNGDLITSAGKAVKGNESFGFKLLLCNTIETTKEVGISPSARSSHHKRHCIIPHAQGIFKRHGPPSPWQRRSKPNAKLEKAYISLNHTPMLHRKEVHIERPTIALLCRNRLVVVTLGDWGSAKLPELRPRRKDFQ